MEVWRPLVVGGPWPVDDGRWLVAVDGRWPVAGGWFAGGRWPLALGGVLVGGPVAGGSRWQPVAGGSPWPGVVGKFKSFVCRKSTKIDFIPFQLDRARGN